MAELTNSFTKLYYLYPQQHQLLHICTFLNNGSLFNFNHASECHDSHVYFNFHLPDLVMLTLYLYAYCLFVISQNV